MKKQKNIIKIISLIVIAMFLITANSFATVGIDNSNTILSMPIIKIIIVVVAGIIIVTLLYNMSQDSSSSAKELIKQMEKNENNKQYSNEYNKKKKNNAIDKKIIEKANEPEKPKVREEYIRESKLDQGLLEEITDLYNKDSKKEDIFDLETDHKEECNEDTEDTIDNISNKKEEKDLKDSKDEIEETEKEFKKVEKVKIEKTDKLAEDFLNNLEMTMREGK